ncbi:hypothetical protein SAMN05421788_107254 [Filimonas lacunae]|uniref:Phage tail protein (Tail_P2_I) n=1 Tax=Filimonas lacunae TaxID=477680 RepID=A0A173MG68_9BACT|nr:hypothetical protein [Filimonas lacunae]BAV06593.1 hypothetical protein FLA_2612 [Filimonas lacunae]SIT27508.1 hypothetical protein SAMN05421788_107254 [Filimonas lacunae]
MSFDIEHLYKLLPAVYRIRDLEGIAPSLPAEDQHGPLKDLLSVLAEQLGVLEENLAQLYDDQFIETCAEWVVPYIGELVGTRGLAAFPGATFSQRAEVANTIMYRRRKGTAAILQQLAHDITGWDALVVEYFQLLATTQYMNHLRPQNQAVTSVRNWEPLQYIATPFDKTPRTADVRSIARNRGKYNIPNIGIYLWRLQRFTASHAPAYRLDDQRFYFHPLGLDIPLYNTTLQPVAGKTPGIAVTVNMPINRRVAAAYLDMYYGEDKSILVFQDDVPVLPGYNSSPATPVSDLVSICNLSDVTDQFGNVIGWGNMPATKIAIDPQLGRIAFPAPVPANVNIYTHHYYGFSREMGGGEYGRTHTFNLDLEKVAILKVPGDMPAITDALQALALTGGVIELTDNEYYTDTTAITIAAQKNIEIRAADNRRPVWALSGYIDITGGADTQLSVNGIVISGGGLRVPANGTSGAPNLLGALQLQHCTLVPGHTPAIKNVPAQAALPRVVVAAAATAVTIGNCICGPVLVTEDAAVQITNSIIDAGSTSAVAYSAPDGNKPGAPLSAENVTFVGKVSAMILEMASNTIFYAKLADADSWTAPLYAERLQQGCVRFSYVPPGSRIPRPFNCVPAATDDPVVVRPAFTSLIYGDAGYAQLSNSCTERIRKGADDGAEMGAFHHLYQPQREANLRLRLNEYLRFGLEAGIYYAS